MIGTAMGGIRIIKVRGMLTQQGDLAGRPRAVSVMHRQWIRRRATHLMYPLLQQEQERIMTPKTIRWQRYGRPSRDKIGKGNRSWLRSNRRKSREGDPSVTLRPSCRRSASPLVLLCRPNRICKEGNSTPTSARDKWYKKGLQVECRLLLSCSNNRCLHKCRSSSNNGGCR